MFCVQCGKQLDETAAFCPGCGRQIGAPVAAAPPMASPTGFGLASHIRLLGILWIAISAFRAIPGLVLASFPDWGLLPPETPPFVPDLLQGISLFFIAGAVLGVIIGVGLLNRRPWARMLAIVFGAIGLLDIPFGTALGIYTLWVLMSERGQIEYRAMSAP
jgi:hypothetical protein